MIQHEVIQGSDAWHSLRASHCCASEAAAMLGFSPYIKRNELLHAKKTYSVREFSDFVQKRVLDKGHEIEAKTRPLAETMIGEDLYPVTGTVEVEGLPLLASFDGITAGDDRVWENKQWNAELALAVEAGEVPPAYWPQLEQQLLISGAEKALFTVSMDGTDANTRNVWYESKPERRQQVIAGWKQFRIDLETYVPVEVLPAVTAAPVKQLPAIIWKRSVDAPMTHNLEAYRTAAEELVERSRQKLETDQDFADCDLLCKAFADAEGKIDLVKAQVLGEIEDVDKFCRDLTEISDLIRQARLNGEKQVKTRKDQIRYEIIEGGKTALAAHIKILTERLGKPYLPEIKADFAGVIKNKRTIESLRNAVDTELARAKIDANAIADRIDINLKKLVELASDHKSLFADAAQIVLKPTEDVVTLINYRMGEHKRKEEARMEEERAKIRAEEEAKAKAEAEAKVRAEAEAKAKEEAERKKKEEDERAQADAAEKAKRDAEEKTRKDAEDKARQEADDKAKAVAKPAPAQPAQQRAAPAPRPAEAASSNVAPIDSAQKAAPEQKPAATAAKRVTNDQLREMIGEVLVDMMYDELRQTYDAVRSIRASRAA